jgi:hypothetical protein
MRASLAILRVVLFLLAGLARSHAQQITGTLVGTIQDPSGAVVNGATVTATNVDTGLAHTVLTGALGEYRIEYLAVGNYSIEVSAAGFKKFVQQHVVITVDQTQRIDAALALGVASETITVSSEPPQINTTTAEIGRTIQAEEIQGLPLTNRNVYTQLSLTAGVQSSSASSGGGGSPSASGGNYNQVVGLPSTQVIINGGTDGGVGTVSFYLDGGINMTGIRNYGNPSPNPDALQEFRVETNNYAAQYGRYSSGVVSLITKSGTNKFHGSLFEAIRNTRLNDTPWNSPVNPFTTGPGTSTNNANGRIDPPYHRNQFGGSIGGPIIPNKTFFFFSYGGLRQITGLLESGSIVPTALERLGDFTQSATKPDLPGTKTVVDGTNSSPNCQVATTGCVPSSLFDQTAANILAEYVPQPLPTYTLNAEGAPNGWAGFFPSPYTNNEYLAKLDHQVSANNHLSVSFFNINSISTVSGGGALLYSGQTDSARQYNVNISDVQIYKSGLVNQVWLGYTRNFGGRANAALRPLNGAATPTSLASFGSNYSIQGQPSLPNIALTGYFTLGQSIQGPTAGSNMYSIRDVASKSIGKHSVDFGAEMSLDKDIQITDLDNWGSFSFSGSTSIAEATGNALADFITGHPATMEQDTTDEAITNSWYYAFFFQDSYRVTPRLTLNLGLRYDFQTPPTDNAQNRESTYVPGGPQSTLFPGTPGAGGSPAGLLFAGDAGVTNGTVALRKHHLSPRIGFAFDPFGDGKTSIRGAAGIFYGGVSGNEWNATSNFAPYALRQSALTVASLTNIYAPTTANGTATSFGAGNPFPYTYTKGAFPKVVNFGPLNEEGASLGFQWPYSYQMNLSVQQQLPGSVTLQVAYVGSLAHDLPFQNDLNYDAFVSASTTANTAGNEALRHRYNFGTLTTGNPTSGYTPGTDLLNEVQVLQSDITSAYNSLQISASKRMSRHFTASGFYVWSHSIWSGSPGGATNADPVQDYSTLPGGQYYAGVKFDGEGGSTDTDQRHIASMSGIWDLSYFKGSNKVLGNIINGWSISPVVSLNSGIPFNLLTGSENNDDGYSANRPNYCLVGACGNATGAGPALSKRPRSQSRFEWFNTAAFVGNACSPGNLPVASCVNDGVTGIGPGGADGNVSRNALRAPGYRDVDLGIFRTFNVWENTKLQFRAEATNAFNMVSMAAPAATGPVTAANAAAGKFTTFATASFGTITSAQGNPRQIQLGARLTF